MGDQLEPWISAMECIQKEFEHDIRKINEQLAKLTKLVKDHTEAKVVHLTGSLFSLIQPSLHLFPHPSPQPYISFTNHKGYRPNLRPLMHALAFMPVCTKTSSFGDQSSNSKDQLKRLKTSKDKIRKDLISLSYAELFPKLVKNCLITPIHLPTLKPSFPKWYDANMHCDYHCGNPEHSIENCTALKNIVQNLIQAGLVKCETSNEQEGDGS